MILYVMSRLYLHFFNCAHLIIYTALLAEPVQKVQPEITSSFAEVKLYLDENADARVNYTRDVWAYIYKNSSILSLEQNKHCVEILCLGLDYDEGRPFVLERLSLPPIKSAFFTERAKTLIQNVSVGQVSDRLLVRAYGMAGLDIGPIENRLDDPNIYALSPAAAPDRIYWAGSDQWIINIYKARRGDSEATSALLIMLQQRPLEYWGQDGLALIDLVFTRSEPLVAFVKRILFETSDQDKWHGDIVFTAPATLAAVALSSSGDTPINYWRSIGSQEVGVLREYYRPGPLKREIDTIPNLAKNPILVTPNDTTPPLDAPVIDRASKRHVSVRDVGTIIIFTSLVGIFAIIYLRRRWGS